MKIFLLAFLLTFSYIYCNTTKIIFASYPIPYFIDNPKQGMFAEICQEAAKRVKVDIEIVIHPTKRSQNLFKHSYVDALLPALKPSLPKNAYLTIPIFEKKLHTVVRPNNKIFKTFKSLYGKKIGLVNGFAYPDSIIKNPAIIKDYSKNLELNLNKLLAKRFDIIVADLIVINLILEKKHKSKHLIYYDESKPIATIPVHIAFQPNLKGKELQKKFNKALKSMKADGTLKKIIAKYKDDKIIN